MTKRVLLLGRTESVVDGARRELEELGFPGIELLGGVGIDGLRSAFAHTRIDHVIMGSGLDLDIRLEIVREIFRSSETTTVHMKDLASGPQGFLPFARSVLTGISG